MVIELDVLESEYAESLFLEYTHPISYIQCIRVKAGLRERRKEGRDDGGWKEGWREGATSDGSQNPVELHIGSTVAHPQLPKET